ncbi:hypothetical protein CISG_05920 [Coccidioides immitis RMSCC 3703]|uniref:Uncharacterized protein n=1 Tax=Coccidioides immitis RMSCC 3703 TaxID=454286 RepID=A0A0J8QZQ6_COCIT|nr:hypothetical protein CISG_05920 [Coccidioides immitis RMSCC 3703]
MTFCGSGMIVAGQECCCHPSANNYVGVTGLVCSSLSKTCTRQRCTIEAPPTSTLDMLTTRHTNNLRTPSNSKVFPEAAGIASTLSFRQMNPGSCSTQSN